MTMMNENSDHKSSSVEPLLSDLREYASRKINSTLMDTRRCFSPHIVLDLGEMGILGQQVPAQQGGLELTNTSCMQLMKQVGAIDLSLAIFVGLHNFLGIRPIMNYSRSEIRDFWLPKVASGRKLTAFALTEPSAGSNAAAIKGTAKNRGDGKVVINTDKMWIGNASWASVINVFVRYHDQDNKPYGINGYLIQEDATGLTVGNELMTMGMRGMVQNRVHFNDVVVDESYQLGKIGHGLSVAQDAMMYTRLALGSIFLGAMQRSLQLCLRFAKRRDNIATGKLLDHPVTRRKLTDCLRMVEVQSNLINFISNSLDLNQHPPEELLITAKVIGSEFLWTIADTASQLMGGRGYIETNEISRIIRDARVGRIFEGPTETMMHYIGSRYNSNHQDLDDYLIQELKSESFVHYLHSLKENLENVIENNPTHNNKVQNRHLLNSSVGTALMWTILACVSQHSGNDSHETNEWLKEKLDQQFNDITSSVGSKVSLDDNTSISRHIGEYESVIGDIDQSMAGEEWRIDPWLQKVI